MQNNMEKHKRLYSLCIGSLCNIVLSMACFTCIVTSQVFVKNLNAMKHSIELLPIIGTEKTFMNSLQL